LEEWLETIPPQQMLRLDVSEETVEYLQSIPKILAKIQG
jgi:hypothetical protein